MGRFQEPPLYFGVITLVYDLMGFLLYSVKLYIAVAEGEPDQGFLQLQAWVSTNGVLKDDKSESLIPNTDEKLKLVKKKMN